MRQPPRSTLFPYTTLFRSHLRYLRPFPKNLGDIIKNFEKVLIPEINNGQLIKIIRDQYLVDAKPYNKIKIGRAQRLNSSHSQISYAVFCLKKKKRNKKTTQ